MTIRSVPLRMRGFTLLEAIIVIVITGVIAGMVAIFIKTSTDSYVNAERRAELTDAADVALRRLAREVRLAVPNSLRVTDDLGSVNTCAQGAATCYIEFIPTRSGGKYRAAGDGSLNGNILDFTNTASKTFDVLGLMPSPLAAGDFVVVYNLGTDFAPANAYLRGTASCGDAPVAPGCNIAAVSSVSTGAKTITLKANPFAYQSPPLPSPNNRFQVVPSSGPVTYSCAPSGAGSNVNRYTSYRGGTAWFAQPTPPTSTPAVAIANATCDVDYAPNVLARTGILFVKIIVTDSSRETVTVFREIHVDNSP